MNISHQSRGFTLIEAVIVIIITGILAAVVAVFLKGPVDAYFDSARRAALTDVADTAARRISRDIQKALPNSIRQTSNQCIEFIPTKTGGRYRADSDASGAGDILDFTAADSSFDMFGLNSALPSDQQIAAGDVIAVYNLGITGSDAYAADNTSAVTSVAAGSLANETKINISSMLFPLASGSNRFHVIPGGEKIVSFVCSGGTLFRNSNYAYASSCPTAGGAVLAQNVSSCAFVYNGSDLQRNATVQMTLNLASGGETVSLYHEVHVNNTP